jgi:uncharacterized membrane protein YqjE
MERPNESGRPLGNESTGSLITRLFRDATEMVNKQVQLARAEIRSEVKGAVSRAIGMAVAGLCALVGVGLLCAAAVLGLAQNMTPWKAALLVAVIMFVIAGIVVMASRSRHHRPLERTQRTLKEDVRWAREQTA